MKAKKVLVYGGLAVGAYLLWKNMGKRPTQAMSGFLGLPEDVAAMKLKYLEANDKYSQVFAAMSPDLEKLDQGGYQSQKGIYAQISDEGLAAYRAMKSGDLTGALQLYDAAIIKAQVATTALQAWIDGLAQRVAAYNVLQMPTALPPVAASGSAKDLAIVAKELKETRVVPSNLPATAMAATPKSSKTVVTVVAVAAGLGLAYMLLRRRKSAQQPVTV